jgi:S-adenosylmethionine:tRNA ribosyltransferase-isomerase
MLVVDREAGAISHRMFRDIGDYMSPGDVLVMNASRVYRARLLGVRESGAPAEVMLLKPLGDGLFEAMVHPGGKLHPGREVKVSAELSVRIESVTERRTRIVRLLTDMDPWDAIEKYGHIPLPPYISRGDAVGDVERYQTVYARERGSVAAPTAGLHFTTELLDSLRASGVRTTEVLLHVGAGTFKPVQAEDPAEHRMHEEWYSIAEPAAELVRGAQLLGGSVVAVGTTSLRALESNALAHGELRADSGETKLFVRPPYEFRVVDRLLTNFHLPRSTLLMLVAAFAGYELTMRAYDEAARERYRFFSYGDAMLIV